VVNLLSIAVESFFNLAWLLLGIASAFWWLRVRCDSDSTSVPGHWRGLLILGCILFILFPVISISDDAVQTPALTEDGAQKDVLSNSKSTLLSYAAPPAALTSAIVISGGFPFWKESQTAREAFGAFSSVSPNIENRPPPRHVFA